MNALEIVELITPVVEADVVNVVTERLVPLPPIELASTSVAGPAKLESETDLVVEAEEPV